MQDSSLITVAEMLIKLERHRMFGEMPAVVRTLIAICRLIRELFWEY